MSSSGKSNDPFTGVSGYGLFSNIKLELYSLYALAILGVLFKIFVVQKNDMTGNQGPATNTIWGYGLASISILCILFIIYGLYNRDIIKNKNFDNKGGFFRNIMYILGNGTLFVLLLLVFILTIVLNYVYYQKINIGIIPDSFNNFNYISNLFMIIQLIVLGPYINTIANYGQIPPKSTSDIKNIGIIKNVTYLLSTLNIIFIVIMYILLRYYSTDG